MQVAKDLSVLDDTRLARSVGLGKRTNRYLVSLLNVVIHLLRGEKSWQRSVSSVDQMVMLLGDEPFLEVQGVSRGTS